MVRRFAAHSSEDTLIISSDNPGPIIWTNCQRGSVNVIGRPSGPGGVSPEPTA